MPKKEKEKKKDPLADWIKTTLWLQVKDGPRVEVNVWHPIACQICLSTSKSDLAITRKNTKRTDRARTVYK